MKDCKSRKTLEIMVLCVLLALMISSCELQQAASQPATPTMGLEVPVVSAETKSAPEAEEDMAAEEEIESDAEAKDVEEETSDEEAPAPAPTETPMPLPTATEKSIESKDAGEEADEEADAESAEELAPTPTEIPYVKTLNQDPLVLVYLKTSCYESPDFNSDVVGVAAGGSALGAFDRDSNWYKVVHPTIGGLTCWISGDHIQPNKTAFYLGD